MANDREEEAWELIRKAAQMNGKPLTKDHELCPVQLQQVIFIFIYSFFENKICWCALPYTWPSFVAILQSHSDEERDTNLKQYCHTLMLRAWCTRQKVGL